MGEFGCWVSAGLVILRARGTSDAVLPPVGDVDNVDESDVFEWLSRWLFRVVSMEKLR